MMNWDRKRFFTLFATTVFLVGCHFFDDPDESFDESDDECPMNSAYPCTCDPDHIGKMGKGSCDDGSYCLYMEGGDPDIGFCSRECTSLGSIEDECSLWDTSLGIGIGMCFDFFPMEAYGGCVLLCEADFTLYGKGIASGKCPWGYKCEGEEFKFCTIPHFWTE